jgi:hypothetical protein
VGAEVERVRSEVERVGVRVGLARERGRQHRAWGVSPKNRSGRSRKPANAGGSRRVGLNLRIVARYAGRSFVVVGILGLRLRLYAVDCSAGCLGLQIESFCRPFRAQGFNQDS